MEKKILVELESKIATYLDAVHQPYNGEESVERYVAKIRRAVNRLNKRLHPFTLVEENFEMEDGFVTFTYAVIYGNKTVGKVVVNNVFNRGPEGVDIATTSYTRFNY